MTSARVPGAAWSWPHICLVLVVLAPVVATGVVAADGDLAVATAGLDALVVPTAAAVAASACYATWRIHPRPGVAWATIGLAALALQELVRAALQVVAPASVSGLRVLVADLSAVVAVVVAVALLRRLNWGSDPAGLGLGVGALVAAGRLLWFTAYPDVGTELDRVLISASYAVVVAAVAGLLWWGGGLVPTIGSVPAWVRQRTALALVLFGGAHVALFLDDAATSRAAVLVGDVVGAVLLVSTFSTLLAGEVQASSERYGNVHDELQRARRKNRAHRARMHEITATVAGITTASRLLRSAEQLDPARRRALEDMLDTELDRLGRLVAPPDPAVADEGPVDLDETIGPIVVAHQARGRRVSWSPSGMHVRASADAVAEMVNVLLDNAARHARSGAEVTVARTGAHVEVAVHDDGPGVDASVSDRLFEWGVRGPHSDGQGIGLHVARELARRHHGSLRFLNAREGGATFVLSLPCAGAPDRVSVRD